MESGMKLNPAVFSMAAIPATMLLAQSAFANQQFTALMAFNMGGDRLTTAQFEDGSDEDIRANEGITFAAGMIIPVSTIAEVEATIGWKSGGAFASNGNVSWSAIPLEATFSMKANQLLFGGGISYFLNPKQEAEKSGKGYIQDIDYDDSMGFHIKAAYQPQQANYRIGAKYTVVDFESRYGDIDGNSFGFFAGLVF